MGSPLTLTIANCYMFFYEQNIVKQINNSNGLYIRYIDDIFIIINWPVRHMQKQIDRWNQFDFNIQLTASIGFETNFLDLQIKNMNGQLFTSVYQKPSYEPYYLPFHSIHPLHMKKNIPYALLLRALRYCSIFGTYISEREKIRMALLLNKYPDKFIEQQFRRIFNKLGTTEALCSENYDTFRQKAIQMEAQEDIPIDHRKTMFVHFTYCSNMRTFPVKFHALWQKYFQDSPINGLTPILGTRNVDNLQRRLIRTRPKGIQ